MLPPSSKRAFAIHVVRSWKMYVENNAYRSPKKAWKKKKRIKQTAVSI